MVLKMKKVVLVDLDGVLNMYNGDFDENVLPLIRSGSKKFLEELSKKYDVKIFTARNKLLTSIWLLENDLLPFVKDVTNIKEPAFLHIDDRCCRFVGNFDEILEEVESFKPWYVNL